MDLVDRTPRPAPWAEGEKIPWNEPAFSARMLREHLSQDHDAASRRAVVINRQVDWIFHQLLGGTPTSVLDLGCGPGLYTSRFAQLGCSCTGIDFSPASIAHARQQAHAQGLDCRYVQADLRTDSFGNGYGLVLFIFGELNVFRPQEARHILTCACQALAPGGLLLLEPHTFDAVRQIGQAPSTWYTSPGGLFSPDPHLCLQENFWDETSSTATLRYFIIDAASGAITRYASTMQAYTHDAYLALLQGCGFNSLQFHPSLEGKPSDLIRQLQVITARK